MIEMLTSIQAVRLAGVSRRILQQKIQSGELPTFEGQIRVDDLRRVFPDTDFSRNAELQRVEAIKEQASVDGAQRKLDRDLPGCEELMVRMQDLSDAFLLLRRDNARQVELLGDICCRLEAIDAHGLSDSCREELAAICQLLRRRLH